MFKEAEVVDFEGIVWNGKEQNRQEFLESDRGILLNKKLASTESHQTAGGHTVLSAHITRE